MQRVGGVDRRLGSGIDEGRREIDPDRGVEREVDGAVEGIEVGAGVGIEEGRLGIDHDRGVEIVEDGVAEGIVVEVVAGIATRRIRPSSAFRDLAIVAIRILWDLRRQLWTQDRGRSIRGIPQFSRTCSSWREILWPSRFPYRLRLGRRTHQEESIRNPGIRRNRWRNR